MFSHISMNWRGKPLIRHAVIVNLIGNTTTKNGLNIRVELDTNKYEKRIKITDEDLQNINLIAHDFHGEWNYSITPKCST